MWSFGHKTSRPVLYDPQLFEQLRLLNEDVGLAEAIYDNTAEWPDELAFGRGELLRVLDTKPGANGTEGWWLCANKTGQRGIVPANRLRLIHSFTPSKPNVVRPEGLSRVITPRRIGDVFMYSPGESLFADGELEEFFGLRNGLNSTLPGTYAVPPSSVRFRSESPLLTDMRLFHSADRPIMLDRQDANERASRPPIVRNVPIRMEQNTIGNGVKKPSPPPPPVRRNFSNLTSASDDNSQAAYQLHQSTYDSPSRYGNTASTYQSPVALRNELGSTAPTIPPAPILSPLSSSSDRSSSLSEDSTRSSSQSFYDVPPAAKFNSVEDNKKSSDHPDNLTSVLLNVLEELHVYDSPRNVLTSANRRDLQSSLRDVLNRSSDSGNLTDSSDGGSLTPVNTGRPPAPYSYTRETLPASEKTSAASNLLNLNLTSTSSSNETLKNVGATVTPQRRTVTFAPPTAYETYDVPPAPSKSSSTPISSALKKSTVTALPSVAFKADASDIANGSINGNGDSNSDRLSLSSLDSKDSDYQAMLTEGQQEIQLSQTAAIAALVNYQSAVQIAVSKLCTFVTKKWRKREILEPQLNEIKACCSQVCSHLADFVQFCLGVFINTSRVTSDQRLAKQLAHMLRPLRNSMRLLESTMEQLNFTGWDLTQLIRDSNAGSDALDRFVAVAKEIPEDCRQVATFIQANSTLIFTPVDNSVQSRPLPPPPANSSYNAPGERLDDFDPELTPSLERRAVMESDYETDAEANLFDDYDYIEGHQRRPGVRAGDYSLRAELSVEDQQILNFYSPQVESHMSCLSEAIDKFLSTIEANKPPKEFVANSKFVILAAHKLVYIGDSIAQCLKEPKFCSRVRSTSDQLCAALRYSVTSTKQAAIQFPAVPSIQAMVDSMVSVSHSAQDLRLLIQNAADT